MKKIREVKSWLLGPLYSPAALGLTCSRAGLPDLKVHVIVLHTNYDSLLFGVESDILHF